MIMLTLSFACGFATALLLLVLLTRAVSRVL